MVAMEDGLMMVGMREASASSASHSYLRRQCWARGTSPSSLILHFLVSVPIIRTFPLHSFSLLVFSDLKIDLSMSHNVYNRGLKSPWNCVFWLYIRTADWCCSWKINFATHTMKTELRNNQNKIKSTPTFHSGLLLFSPSLLLCKIKSADIN